MQILWTMSCMGGLRVSPPLKISLRVLMIYFPALTKTPLININLSSQSKLSQDGDRIITRFEKQIVFVEYRYLEARSDQEVDEAILDVRKLASVLCNVDAEAMHILRCIGTADQLNIGRTSIIYSIPRAPMPNMKWTLQEVLKSSERPSLDIRVRYALEISEAIMYTHAAGLVHKSVCPSNILGTRMMFPGSSRN